MARSGDPRRAEWGDPRPAASPVRRSPGWPVDDLRPEPDRMVSALAPRRRARVPALDGLRAIAVVAVLLYHAEFGWAKGGYLGVDLFFVLSGFLVTGLLLNEHDRSGGVALRDFWSRRVRRLVPAQIALLLAVLLFTFLLHRPELYELRGQIVAALTATMNWFLFASGQSYFDAIGRPPVLRHLWSLAIEMQFYLAWPIVFGAMLRAWRRQIGVLLAVILGTAAFSILLMWILYQADDPSRVYYSTFTRLFGLLFGAALAIVWRPDRLPSAPVARLGGLFDRAGMIALALAVVCFMTMGADQGWMYRTPLPILNGFVFFSLLAVVLVAVASHPTTWLGGRSGLGHPVLVAIGERSYGIYLWHWPIYAYTRPGQDLHIGTIPTLVLRLVLTALCSELCFRLVERPWQNRQMTMRDLRRVFSRPDPGEILRPVVVGIGSLLLLAALVSTLLAPVHQDQIVAEIEKGEQAIKDQNAKPPTTTASTTTTTDPAADTSTTTATTTPVTVPGGQKAIPDLRVDGKLPFVTAIGDSVMVGAAPALIATFGRDNIWIDAEKGRQAKGLPDLITTLKNERGLGGIVVVHIGTNGTFTEEQIRATAAAVGDIPIVFVTARADRSWVPSVNENLARVVPTLPHAYLVDWYAYSNSHNDWFGHDGVHPDEEGRLKYANLIHGSLIGQPPTS